MKKPDRHGLGGEKFSADPSRLVRQVKQFHGYQGGHRLPETPAMDGRLIASTLNCDISLPSARQREEACSGGGPMLRISKCLIGFGVVLLALCSGDPARADIITVTFDESLSTDEPGGVPSGVDSFAIHRPSALTTQGFNFVATGPPGLGGGIHFHAILNPAITLSPVDFTKNGTRFIASGPEDVTTGGPVNAGIRMTPANGGTFGLISFDVAEGLVNDNDPFGARNADFISVTGFLQGGGMSGVSFPLDTGLEEVVEILLGDPEDFQHFDLDPLLFGQDLVAVEFRGGVFSGVDAPNFSLDNIKVTATIPEPSTLALFGLGLAGLVVYGRKRRK
jgi:hypothetical protein